MSEPLVLRPEQARRKLGVGRDLMYELLRTGVVPSVVLGKRRYVPREALRKVLTQNGEGKEHIGE